MVTLLTTLLTNLSCFLEMIIGIYLQMVLTGLVFSDRLWYKNGYSSVVERPPTKFCS